MAYWNAATPQGEEFGVERLIASLLEAKQQSAHATLMMLLAAVQDFANGSPLLDDVSLTLIQRDEEPGIAEGKVPAKLD